MDPTDSLAARLLRIKTAVRVSEAFRVLGYRAVQYGGATVEFYTSGLYATGDVDIGFIGRAPSLETKNQVMESLGCRQGVRLYNLDGVIVDLGGEAELFSTQTRELVTEDGSIILEAAEESGAAFADGSLSSSRPGSMEGRRTPHFPVFGGPFGFGLAGSAPPGAASGIPGGEGIAATGG